MPPRAREAHGMPRPSQPVSACLASRCCRQSCGNLKRPLDHLDEVSFFAKDEPFCLRHLEVTAPFRIRLDARPVRLIRTQAVERNQRPGHVVRSLVRKKIPHQVPAASRNDAAPILRVLPERFPLERIDLVANDAGNLHGFPFRGRCGPRIAAEGPGFSPAVTAVIQGALAPEAKSPAPASGFSPWRLPLTDSAACLYGTLRLSSKYGCRRPRGRRSLRNRRGHRRARAST